MAGVLPVADGVSRMGGGSALAGLWACAALWRLCEQPRNAAAALVSAAPALLGLSRDSSPFPSRAVPSFLPSSQAPFLIWQACCATASTRR